MRDFQSGFNRFLGEQASSKHHAWIGGVGARGDGCNQDVSVMQGFTAAGCKFLIESGSRLVKSVVFDGFRKQAFECAFNKADFDTVLRTFWAGKRRHDGTEIKLDGLRVINVGSFRHAVHILCFEIRLESLDFFFSATRSFEILDGARINRKESHRRTILRRHIADCCAIGGREAGCTRTTKLNKFADDFFPSE